MLLICPYQSISFGSINKSHKILKIFPSHWLQSYHILRGTKLTLCIWAGLALKQKTKQCRYRLCAVPHWTQRDRASNPNGICLVVPSYIMNHQFYGAAHATLPRRATVPAPASLAPTASMIDPALEHHAFQYTTPQFTHNGGNRLHNQSHPNMMNGFPQPLSQHQQHQQPQTNSAQSTPQALSNPSTERCLPSKDVNEANFDSAYVQFILYCNPSIPFNVETEELRKGFLNPPRSDGNSFSPWNLFHLLQRLERKEIKTWAHLVTELGVEPPDKEKNQSTQKVQQYAVRLKVSFRSQLLYTCCEIICHPAHAYISYLALDACISCRCLFQLSFV